jgi:immunity protein 27 of polymorphic toxin system
MNGQNIKLQPNEQILSGRWRVEDGRARADATCDRIDWLITRHLQKVADSPQSGAWETLYRDPDDGRYWERSYPQGEMHGGGPSQLKWLTVQEARKKYGDSAFAAE